MSDTKPLLQCVVNQRDQAPTGWRILPDGVVQHAVDNPPPGPDDSLASDRALNWQTRRQLDAAEIASVKTAVLESGFFDLLPKLLINYCKEDPGTAIWTAHIDGREARVVLFDPRPRRSAELDKLSGLLAPLLEQKA
jgi:hypothetical protein